jgi:membrane protein DedA with SNARE-associated domain
MRSQTADKTKRIVRRSPTQWFLLLEAFSMLVWLAVILLVAWLLGWGVFHVAGGLIHLLLVIALVVFLINFISGRRTV